jgi:hypothetical protein
MTIHLSGYYSSAHIINCEDIMSGKREIACGVDVHNKFIVATILSSDGLKFQDRFDTTLDGLLKFKSWLKENGCHKVAAESTGNYWIPLYRVFGRICKFHSGKCLSD